MTSSFLVTHSKFQNTLKKSHFYFINDVFIHPDILLEDYVKESIRTLTKAFS